MPGWLALARRAPHRGAIIGASCWSRSHRPATVIPLPRCPLARLSFPRSSSPRGQTGPRTEWRHYCPGGSLRCRAFTGLGVWACRVLSYPSLGRPRGRHAAPLTGHLRRGCAMRMRSGCGRGVPVAGVLARPATAGSPSTACPWSWQWWLAPTPTAPDYRDLRRPAAVRRRRRPAHLRRQPYRIRPGLLPAHSCTYSPLAGLSRDRKAQRASRFSQPCRAPGELLDAGQPLAGARSIR